MIKPNKHLDLDYSVIRVTSEMIKIFERSKVMSYDEILERIIIIMGEDAKYNFVSALNILYLFDKINYFPDRDIFEYAKEIKIKGGFSSNETEQDIF